MTIRMRLPLMYASLTFRKASRLRKSKVIPAVADQILSLGPSIACFQLRDQEDDNNFCRRNFFEVKSLPLKDGVLESQNLAQRPGLKGAAPRGVGRFGIGDLRDVIQAGQVEAGELGRQK